MTDVVDITRAEYAADKQELRVEATTTGQGATLTVYVTSSGDRIGTLRSLGGGKYGGQLSWPVNPESITVRSSLGGSDTSAVTLK